MPHNERVFQGPDGWREIMAAKEKNPDAILVALDGSAPSHTAASLATKIARKQHLPIRGLYVVDPTMVCDLYASP